MQILLASTGGTIASLAGGPGGVLPRLGAAELGNAIALPDGIELVHVDLLKRRSSGMTPGDMNAVARAISSHVEQGSVGGVVVTHGTDAIEETAYALAVQLDRRVPVVLTGAMRLADAPGADGPANLSASISAAIDPRVAALGPVVVMNNEIHLARHVAKVHAARLNAFASPACGPAGEIVEGRVHLHCERVPEDRLGLPASIPQRVELIWMAAGADELLVDAAAEAASGIVIAGTGGGHVPPPVAGALARALERGVVVVIASRCVGGPTLSDSYDGVGSERHLRELGVVSAGDLHPLKARLRLLVALALGIPAARAFG